MRWTYARRPAAAARPGTARLAPLAVAAMAAGLVASSAAVAGPNVVDDDLITAGFGRDDTSAHLVFDYRECADFCRVVEFRCDRAGFAATMYYFDSVEMANWLTLQGGAYPRTVAIRLTLRRGGIDDEVPIEIIAFGDGPQMYSVTAVARRVPAAWYAAFATGDLAVATPSRTLDLPGTPADLAERAAFADACRDLAAG